MKTILLRTRTKWLLSLSPILAAVLMICCYSAIANARRAGNQDAQILQHESRPDHYKDPEYVNMRREFSNRFLGTAPGRVSPDAYTDALAATRALPPSPLLERGTFTSAGAPEPNPPTPGWPAWTFPVPPPLGNDWGGGGSVRIDAIAVHPGNGDIVYVGSEGGLAKTTDGGTTWSYLSDGFVSQNIRSIAIDPIAPNIIYAGTGLNWFFGVGIYRSVDSGATWALLPGTQFNGSTVGKILIDPVTAGSQTSTTVYASVSTSAQTHSVWRSTNSGTNWSSLRTSGGAPWWAGFTFYDLAIDPAAPSTLYFTAPDGVFKWGTNGRFIKIHDIPDNLAPSCLAFAQSVLYLAYKNGSTIIEKSTNQGASWSAPLPNSGAELWCFGVDPVHPNRLFVGGGGDLRYSLDSGNTWLSSQNVHVDHHSIAFSVTHPERNYLGTDGGIYRADYPGSGAMTWANKNQNLVGCLMQGVSISSDGHMVMGNQDNGNQYYAGGNTPWTMIRGGDGYKPQIDQYNSNKFYFVGLSYGQPVAYEWLPLTRVINGVWTNVTPPGAIGEYTSIFPALFMAPGNSNRVLLGFQNVWRSTNSGDSWTRIGGSVCNHPPSPNPNCGIDPYATVEALYEAPNNTEVIYAITRGGTKLLVTSSAGYGWGATWADRTLGLPGGINAVTVHPTDANTAYAACSTAVYKTTNQGLNWTMQGAPANAIYRDVAIDWAFPSRVFAASHVAVYASTNSGGSWTNISAGSIPAGMAIWNLSFNAPSCLLAASTYGRGAYVINLDAISPTVSITSPANGATVSGAITVSATASDNVAVVGVQFKLDGGDLEGEDLAAPFAITWKTYTSPPGNHTLTAVARDAAGNTTTSAPVTVTVQLNE